MQTFDDVHPMRSGCEWNIASRPGGGLGGYALFLLEAVSPAGWKSPRCGEADRVQRSHCEKLLSLLLCASAPLRLKNFFFHCRDAEAQSGKQKRPG
jgi:hypothetical protein